MISSSKFIKKFLYSGLLLLVFLPAFLMKSPHAMAATITVNTTDDEMNVDGDCSFREAVQASEDNAHVDACVGLGAYGDDIINFTGLSGTILVTGGEMTITQTLTLQGPGVGTLTIANGTDFQRLFVFDPVDGNKVMNISDITLSSFGDLFTVGGISGSTLRILAGTLNVTNATITNSPGDTGMIHAENGTVINITSSTFENGFAGAGDGGAVYSNGATITIDQSNFINNLAGFKGGAIYVGGGTTTITNSLFDGNSFAEGAHLYVDNGGVANVTNTDFQNMTLGFAGLYTAAGGTLTIEGGSIVNNDNPEAGYGALDNHGDTTLTNVVIDDNNGMGNASGTMTLNHVTVSNSYGGLGGLNVTGGNVTAIDSTFTGHTTSTYGAGIYQQGGILTLQRSSVYGNAATNKGGGIFIYPYAENTTTNLINSTIANNSAVNNGGGIHLDKPGAFSGTLNLYNVTLSGNTTSSDLNGGNLNVVEGSVNAVNTLFVKSGLGKNCNGSIADNGSNLQYGDSTCAGITETLSNPLDLAGLTNNGGFTLTIALAEDSEALDAGDDLVCSDPLTINSFDQRGEERPSGLSCDIGAYEFQVALADTIPPTITNVTASTANGTYSIGQTLSIQLVFDEAVTVMGIPQLMLETGDTDAVVNYTSGSGTDTLVFDYTISAGDHNDDLDYVGINALVLNGGSIQDAALNDATLTLPVPGAVGSLGSNKNLVVDGHRPVVASVTSSKSNGTYTTNELIPIQIVFNEVVMVVGTLNLTLETGNSDAVLSYASGSGTDTLTFNYTVAAGQNSQDLDYVDSSSLTLNDAFIRDVAGNNAILTLPVPGDADSLSGNKNLIIDTRAPLLTLISDVPSQPYGGSSAIAVFHSDEGGMIDYSVQCPADVSPASGSTITADDVTITFGPLTAGTVYEHCAITVTDVVENMSNVLEIGTMDVIYPPVLPDASTPDTNGTSGGGGGGGGGGTSNLHRLNYKEDKPLYPAAPEENKAPEEKPAPDSPSVDEAVNDSSAGEVKNEDAALPESTEEGSNEDSLQDSNVNTAPDSGEDQVSDNTTTPEDSDTTDDVSSEVGEGGVNESAADPGENEKNVKEAAMKVLEDNETGKSRRSNFLITLPEAESGILDACKQDYPEIDFDIDGLDEDRDGLSNKTECYAYTNPAIQDTDADGCYDGQEINQLSSNPLDSNDCSPDILKETISISSPQNNWLLSELEVTGLTPDSTNVVHFMAFPVIDQKANAQESVNLGSLNLFSPSGVSNQYFFRFNPKNPLKDGMTYDLVAVGLLTDGAVITSLPVRFTLDSTAPVNAPKPTSIGDVAINDLTLKNLRVTSEDGNVMIEGESDYGAQVFAVWESVVLASSVMVDSNLGHFSIQTPSGLTPEENHKVTLYALKQSDEGAQHRSQNAGLDFYIKSPSLLPLFLLIGFIFIASSVLFYRYFHKKRGNRSNKPKSPVEQMQAKLETKK